jgi:hypothetical protein
MEKNGLRAVELLQTLRGNYPAEKTSLIADIEAMSRLGLYYACKFRAAVYLQLCRKTGAAKWQQQAVSNAQKCAENWTAYSASMAKRYRPQRLSRLRNTVSPDMFDDCARFVVVFAGGGRGGGLVLPLPSCKMILCVV